MFRTFMPVDAHPLRADNFFIMRAAAYRVEYDEVPVSSTEVLESNVVAIRDELKEHKVEFRAAMARLDNDIRMAVSKLEAEIRTMSERAARDLKDFAVRIEVQLAELRAEDKSLHDNIDSTNARIDDTNARLDSTNARIDATNARLDVTNDKLTEISKSVNRLDSKFNALFWVIGGCIAIATFFITVGNAVGWFEWGSR